MSQENKTGQLTLIKLFILKNECMIRKDNLVFPRCLEEDKMCE